MGTDWHAKWTHLREAGASHVAPEDLPFPTEAQTDLLKAALLPAGQAAPAWRRWKASGLRLDRVDDASCRVFPILWLNRDAAGIGAEDLPLLKGVYRGTFAANAGRLAAALDASQLLVTAGVPVVFIKGAAMLGLSGGRLGARRIDDVDLLVPEQGAETALSTLTAAGYQPDAGHQRVGVFHAWHFRAPQGAPIDLHWWGFKLAGDDSAIFDTAAEAVLLGTSVLIPSVSECLIGAVGNAFQIYGSPMRWIADAMFLLGGAGGDVDWDVVLARASRPGLALRLNRGLTYLAEEFSAPVPEYVLDDLRRRSVGWRERAAYWAAVARPPVGAAVLEQMDCHRARLLHTDRGLPRDLLWHLAVRSGRRRRDIVRRAPRTALRAVAVAAISYAGRSKERIRAR